MPGEKHTLQVQRGEYADYRYATQFDGFGHPTASKQVLSSPALKADRTRGGPRAAVANALPLDIEVTPELEETDVYVPPPVVDSLDDEQRDRVRDTLAFIRVHSKGGYTGFRPASSSVVGL